MKIAYLVPYISQSGPVNVVKYLCEELKKKHDVEVFYFKNIKKVTFPVSTHKIGFFEKIDFDKYDVIHSHGVLPDAYVWLHRRSIKKAKTVTTLHNYVKEDYKYAYNPIKAFVLAKVWNIVTSKHDQVVVLSQDAVDYYKDFWKNKNITYVYNGIPPNTVIGQRHKQFSGDNNIKIGGIGSGDITKRKGFDQVVKALKNLPNYSFFIAGIGQEVENLKHLADKTGVGSRVHFVGFQENISSFIEEMSIFVIPSRSEGFSLVLQEIARQKKPAVCSNIPIFKELLTSKEVNFFELEDTHSLSDAIQQIAVKKEEYANSLYEKYLASYTAKKMSENYLNLYKNLIECSVK